MNSAMKSIVWACPVCIGHAISPWRALRAGAVAPPIDKCVWERLTDKNVGLAAWVQRCDFGFRQIISSSRQRSGHQIQRWRRRTHLSSWLTSARRTAEAALQQLFLEKTDKAVSARYVLTPTRREPYPRASNATHQPRRRHAKELEALADPNEIPTALRRLGRNARWHPVFRGASGCDANCCSSASARTSRCSTSRRCRCCRR